LNIFTLKKYIIQNKKWRESKENKKKNNSDTHIKQDGRSVSDEKWAWPSRAMPGCRGYGASIYAAKAVYRICRTNGPKLFVPMAHGP
jgi:hypothetical protein